MNIYDYIKEKAEKLGLNYFEGSFKSTQKFLIESSRNKKPISARYPLLLFVTSDAIEASDVDLAGNTEYDVHLILLNITKQNYSTRERIEHNFKPVLWPLYETLKREFKKDTKDDYKLLPHTKRDIFFYSTDDVKSSNKLAERLDAIDITNLKLLFNFEEKYPCNKK